MEHKDKLSSTWLAHDASLPVGGRQLLGFHPVPVLLLNRVPGLAHSGVLALDQVCKGSEVQLRVRIVVQLASVTKLVTTSKE